jgi:hypothetical protein
LQSIDFSADSIIPRIHELRAKEMHNISIPVLGAELIIYDLHMNEMGTEIIPGQGESVLLRELWLTTLGHETLSKFNFGLCVTLKGFERIQSDFKKSRIKYQFRRVKEESNLKPSNVSKAMASLILSQIK